MIYSQDDKGPRQMIITSFNLNWKNLRLVIVPAVMVTMLMIGYENGFTALASSPNQPLSSPSLSFSDSIGKHFLQWPHEKSELPPDPALVFGRLTNGFRYVLMKNKRPADRVSMHLYINAGSLNETDDQQGLAHYLEHMLFNGSSHFPPGELVRYFQRIGMQFGNDANAHTGFDETVYDIILPTGGEKSLKEGLLVVGDYATGALLLEEEVNRERGVILSEKMSRDSANYRTFKATMAFELPDSLVSQRMPIGATEVIQKTDRSMLKTFYDTWYRPENMTLVMVGDFRLSLAERLIKKEFEDFLPRAESFSAPALGSIHHEGVKAFHHYEPEAGGTTVSIEVLRSHYPSPDSLKYQRSKLIEDMGDRILQNRFDARLKEKDAPFTSATVGSGVYLNRIRYAEISADSKDDCWDKTIGVIEQELRRAQKYGFDESELVRVKKNILKMLENAVTKAPTRDSTRMARSIISDLSGNRVIQSPKQKRSNLAPIIQSVTLAEVHQVLHENWPDDHRLIIVTGNTDLKKLSTKTPELLINEVYEASSSTDVKRLKRKDVVTFPYLPEPNGTATIVEKKVVEDLGITRIQFANGFRLNIKQTDYKTNEVLASLIFGHGKSAEPKYLPGISLVAEEVIGESGLGVLDTDELERALAGKSTYVDFRISETHFNFFAETISDELELLFQLYYAHIVDLGFRADALTLTRERLRQDYASLSRSIAGMMRIEGLHLLAGGDSRFGMPSYEKIQAIGLDDIKTWLDTQVKKAPLELSIVGDFDENRVIELAGRYLGTLEKRDRLPDNTRTDMPRLPKGMVNHIDVDTQIIKAMVVVAWQTDDFWDIHRTRRLSVLSEVFSERLRQRIREKLSISYSPFAFNRSSRAYKGYGVFQAYVNVAPDMTDMVLKEVKSIAADLIQNGVSSDELKRSIDPILNSIKAFRQTNGYWLNSVMTGLDRYPQQIEWARHFVKDYSSITKKDLGDLSSAYLTDERSAAIILQPKH